MLKNNQKNKLKNKLKNNLKKIQMMKRNDPNFFFEKEMSELIGFHLPFEEALEHPVS